MRDKDGPIDAAFEVEALPGGQFGIVFGSWSRAKGTPNARNIEYVKGLQTLLARLGALHATVYAVDRAPSNRPERKRLDVAGRPWPWRMSELDDAVNLQIELGRAQAAVNRTPGTGNRTNRLFIQCAVPGFGSPGQLALVLSAGNHGLPDPGESAGYQPSAEVRSVVERCAMDAAVQYYQSRGWTVDSSVALTESFDLSCMRGEELLHVEVKGTTGRGSEVLLTWREVEHAQSFPNVALAVVSGITVDYGSPLKASGGSLAVYDPWRIADCQLTPTQYRCTVPATT